MRFFQRAGMLSLGFIILFPSPKQSRADDSFTCPVTKTSEQTFVPPAPWEPTGPWFGTERLWTRVQMWGTHSLGKDQLGFQQPKLAWFSSQFDWTPEHWPQGASLLTITGRRLDGPSAPLIFDGASSAYVPDKGPFVTASVHLPTLGCWEITGHYRADNLTFVIKVGP